jgi:hypothetical protein
MELKRTSQARIDMPECTSFIDEMRNAFGKDYIDEQMVKGRADGSFYAIENGFVIGQPPDDIVSSQRRYGASNKIPLIINTYD